MFAVTELATSDWPIFVLTLHNDDERRRPLLSALDDAGVPYRLFMGVDGRRQLPGEYETLVDREAGFIRNGRQMTDGELACALSHRQIYAHISETGLPGAIILEDDAVLQPGFADFIHAGEYKHLPMVLIGFSYGRALPFRRIPVAGGGLRRAAVQATMAAGYSLSATVARKLYAANTPVSHPADWPASLYDLGAWLMVPRLVTHLDQGQCPSHLERQRSASMAGKSRCAPQSLAERLRRRISIRVGRAKGQR